MSDLFHRFAGEEAQAKGLDNVTNLLAQGWRTVSGYERYLISRDGVVFSSIRAGRFLKPTLLTSGYEYVSLMDDGQSKPAKHLIHRLVATAFCAGSGAVVNHKDGNKLNNRAENLEWCSYAENNDHARNTGLTHNFGSRHYAAKLKAEDVLVIRRRASLGEYHREIAEDFGVNRRTITGIVSCDRWRRVK